MDAGTRLLSSAVLIAPRPRARAIANFLSALSAWVILFKLRVVVLLILASIGGALLASGGRPAASDLLLVVITGALSSAGASALNQYLERTQDARMQRTRQRPLAAGSLRRPEMVLVVSVGLIGLALLIALPLNRLLALFLALGALIYVGVYTLWLKPRTWLNIVVGGAAGSCAVLSGSAAVGNWAHPTAVGLALLVFTWTPIHFWSLALAYRDDYAAAGVPMLPALVSGRTAAWWMLLHTAATALIALGLGLDLALGWLYLLPAGLATLWLGLHSIRVVVTPSQAQASKLFQVSNVYLGLVLLAIYVGTLF